MLTKYKGYCNKCKSNQPHYISKTNVRRGAKLTCLACGNPQKTYHKIFMLKEFSEINEKDENKNGTNTTDNKPREMEIPKLNIELTTSKEI
jgi:hypothetical protein